MDTNEKKLPELDPEETRSQFAAVGADIIPPAVSEAENSAPAGSTAAQDNSTKPQGSPENTAPEEQSGTEKPQSSADDTSAEPQERMSDREVMQHTASLWRYKTVSEDGTERHDESHGKHTSNSSCEIIGARVRGKKHKHEGTNCDDWFETAQTEDCAIAVVADGAGSKQLSRIGARVSCESAVEFLKRELSELFSSEPGIKEQLSSEIGGEPFMAACGKLAALMKGAASAAFNAVISQLKEVYSDENYITSLGRNPVLADMGCTFLAAAAVPLMVNGERQNFVITVQIGDGCIAAIDSAADHSSCFKLLGEADSGAYSGETDFLSEKNVSEGVIARKTRISRGKSDIIMLMSDGVADDYFPAQPMMKRLYLDLCLNGILPIKGECGEPLPPEPVKFPSVTPEQQPVAVQYAKQLLRDNSEEAVNELWDARADLKPHSLEAWGCSLGESPEQRLVSWLDNYNERGSFDDRTLVVLHLNSQ